MGVPLSHDEAARRIQAAIRGFIWRRRIQKTSDQELMFIGMKPKVWRVWMCGAGRWRCGTGSPVVSSVGGWAGEFEMSTKVNSFSKSKQRTAPNYLCNFLWPCNPSLIAHLSHL